MQKVNLKQSKLIDTCYNFHGSNTIWEHGTKPSSIFNVGLKIQTNFLTTNHFVSYHDT